MTGITPDRVTNIVVVEEVEEEEEGRVGASFYATAANSIRLKYKVTVFDPLVTVQSMRAQMVQAVQEGRMNAALRTYAAQFGATGLNNATFGEPQITSAAVQRGSTSQLTGVQIALLVIGVVMSVVIGAAVWIGVHQQRASPSPVVSDLV